VAESCAAGALVLGIGSESNGALAWVRGHELERVLDLPLQGKLSARGRQVDVACLQEVVRALRPDYAVVESRQPAPREGVGSAFSRGRTLGAIEAALAGERVEYRLVRPSVWKRSAGLLKAPKAALVDLVCRLYPDVAAQMRLRLHQGRAEAILIARYGAPKGAWENGARRGPGEVC